MTLKQARRIAGELKRAGENDVRVRWTHLDNYVVQVRDDLGILTRIIERD